MPQPKKHTSGAARQAAYRARATAAQYEQLRARGLPPVPAISAVPGRTRWNAALREAARLLDIVNQEMRAYHEDRTETWQESDRGQVFIEQADAVEAILNDLNELDPIS